jgi:hypothetical protein
MSFLLRFTLEQKLTGQEYTKFYCYQVNPFIYSKDSLLLISLINSLTWLKHSSKNEIRSGLGVLISNVVVSERFFNSITDQDRNVADLQI